jgi:GNAT superfamily N-acetyltransferase
MQEIKKSSTNEIPLIQQLSKEIWNKVYPTIISQEQIDFMLDMMYSEEALHQQMTELNHQFIIIYFSGTPVGFASYSVKSIIEPTVIRLNKLYLQPEYHGKGLGRAIVVYIIPQAKLLAGSLLELNVNKNNPAVAFYKRQGFSIASETVLDIGNGYVMDDYIMTLPL